ncbi:PIN domain-containing protein [Treponema succinifaciens]|uniref:type II toxin-antitoxin system VapC family toxin n=1 Tax=Treponema succinifaciens TaxID=167 RepID=UPI0023541637|nr:PIN domain-containing protein [Treponema succinifaciens]
MKILIDTNIILDLIQSREPFSENASKIINSCVKKENEGYISAHSLSDIFFILRKDKTVEERKALILNLCSFFIVIPEDKNFYTAVCQNNDWNDLEDGLQMKCADFENLDYIVTRDAGKGFNNSPVKVISAENFLNI